MAINTDDVPAARAYASRRAAPFERAPRRSLYVTMRDGVRIAVDVHLPEGAPGRLPAIVRQTRYFRSMRVHPRAARVVTEERFDPINGAMRDFFVRRGYAWVDVDVRGSGASFGSWASPWSPDEVRDGAEIVAWIVQQPWSNGRVGATGNSYDGTAAELLAGNGHPALRAIAPRCSLFDVYTDIAYPGGVRQSWFTRAWTRANMGLDANRPAVMIAEALGQRWPRLGEGRRRALFERALGAIVRGVRAVDGEEADELLARALVEHRANMDVDRLSAEVEYRDDVHDSPMGPSTIDAFSPSTYADRVRDTDVAVLGISGWFDGAYAHGAIKRHLTLGRATDKLLVGPWNHGCTIHGSPHAHARRASFALSGELLRFFDRHLRDEDTGIDDEPPVRFYAMGEERWHGAKAWPPPDAVPTTLHLRRGGRLDLAAPASDEGATDLAVDAGSGSGRRSRWRTLVSPFVVPDYRDRRVARGAGVFATTPLDAPLDVVGHPLVTLWLRSDEPDGAVFVYLEEETPDGRVLYVTEGQLRLVHHAVDEDAPRAFRSPAPNRPFTRTAARPFPRDRFVPVVVDLLPVAHRFARGARIRLTIRGADVDHFAPVRGASRWAIAHGPRASSRLELPVRPARPAGA